MLVTAGCGQKEGVNQMYAGPGGQQGAQAGGVAGGSGDGLGAGGSGKSGGALGSGGGSGSLGGGSGLGWVRWVRWLRRRPRRLGRRRDRWGFGRGGRQHHRRDRRLDQDRRARPGHRRGRDPAGVLRAGRRRLLRRRQPQGRHPRPQGRGALRGRRLRPQPRPHRVQEDGRAGAGLPAHRRCRCRPDRRLRPVRRRGRRPLPVRRRPRDPAGARPPQQPVDVLRAVADLRAAGTPARRCRRLGVRRREAWP